ncbi:MAG: aspartyl/asparaginyl beta-hydroxylase domain-containing protein, partial [Methylomonas sp.]
MQIPVIPSALRLPFTFDPVELNNDLARVAPGDWQKHFNHDIYQGDWSGVALRTAPGNPIAIYSNPAAGDNWVDSPL